MRKKKEQTAKAVEPSDQTLIKRYLKGEAAAFDILYNRYRLPLYAYLNQMFREKGREVVDDLFQQTWLKVIANLRHYKDRKTFMAWTLRIARNTAIDHIRRNARFVEMPDNQDSLPDYGENPLQSLTRQQDQQSLTRAIEELPNAQKEVVLLRLQDISFKEIARLQKVSINTALGRMRYAVLNLRDSLLGEQNKVE